MMALRHSGMFLAKHRVSVSVLVSALYTALFFLPNMRDEIELLMAPQYESTLLENETGYLLQKAVRAGLFAASPFASYIIPKTILGVVERSLIKQMPGYVLVGNKQKQERAVLKTCWSSRLRYLKASALAIVGARKRAIGTLENLVEKDPDYYLSYFGLSSLYYTQDRVDDSLHMLNRGFDQVTKKKLSFSPYEMLTIGEMVEDVRLMDAWKKTDSNLKLHRAALSFIFGDHRDTFESVEAALSLDDISPEMVIMGARIQSHVLRNCEAYHPEWQEKTRATWQRGASHFLEQQTIPMSSLGEASHEVTVIDKGRFLRNTIVLKTDSKEGANAEHELTGYLEDRLHAFDRYHVPTPLGVFERGGKHLFVMEFAQGKTLFDKIEKKDETYKEDIKDVTDFLALLHVTTPTGMIHVKERDDKKVIRKRLEEVVEDEETVIRIADNLGPVTKLFKGCERVYSKDAHPENWLLTKNGEVYALDCANNRLDPAEFDLANLMIYGDYLSDSEKDNLLQVYVDGMNKYNEGSEREVDDDLRRNFHNAVIIRSLQLFAPLTPRETRKHLRKDVVNNALHAVWRLKREHGDYYTEGKNRKKYVKLYTGLRRLRAAA